MKTQERNLKMEEFKLSDDWLSKQIKRTNIEKKLINVIEKLLLSTDIDENKVDKIVKIVEEE